MITILTQNKKRIMDCSILEIRDEKVGIKGYSITSRHFNNILCLGTYATEERAKEVLMEIWETIKLDICVSRFSKKMNYNASSLYEMPEA